MCIELGKLGYRTGEPVGIERETSIVWTKVLTALWSKRITKENVANLLYIPFDNLENLVFNLTGTTKSSVVGGPLQIVRNK
jgi:hypothetical protein